MQLIRFIVLLAFTETCMATMGTSRGAFILFEGIDRCGKTTQCGLIAKYLSEKVAAEAIRFPNRQSTIGKLIDSYLNSSSDMSDETIHLLFSANRWEAKNNIVSKLQAGTNLVCDRYAYSGVAFSAAKGMDLTWCKTCDKGLPAPDVVIFLNIDEDHASKRGQYGEERYEKIEFQKLVKEKFLQLKNEDEHNNIPWYILDATQSIDSIHNQIKDIVENIMNKINNEPIKKLWAQGNI